jgi:2-methylcitrate dehydratase PrpD
LLLIRDLARLDLPALGDAPIEKARLCLIDFLSAAFESLDLATSVQARSILTPAAGAHVIGTSLRAAPGEAAFANAVAGHGLVREDMHAGSIAHHGVVIWPALLAMAERGGFSGLRLLEAAVVGYEFGCRLGRALFDAQLARLFRPTGLAGPIGAAAGGAYLLDLDEGSFTSAVALAANMSGGLNQWPHSGSGDMYFHPGLAARSAVTAVALAQAGAFGSPDILEGEAGLFAAFARKPCPPLALFPDGEADILNVYNKPVPACNFAQTACQVAYRLAQQLAPDAAPIEQVMIRVSRAAVLYPGCDFAGPFHRALQAKMSIQFGVAAALAHRNLGEGNYRDLADPVVSDLIGRCTLEADPDFTAAFPARQGAEIELHLADGRRLKTSLLDVVPATEAEIRARFRESASAALGKSRARALEAFIDNMRAAADVGRLPALAALPRRSRTGDRPQA